MIFEWLPRAYEDGGDIMPRMKMQQAAMMAGIPLANGGSGISHALGHTIGGLFHIHHGVLVLLFIPYELQVYSKVTDRYLESVSDGRFEEYVILNPRGAISIEMAD